MLFTIVSNIPRSVNASYDLSQVAYYDRVKQAIGISEEQEEMLKEYGFSIAEMNAEGYSDQQELVEEYGEIGEGFIGGFEDFYCEKVYRPDLPVFVTTDSVLHLFHVVFDCSLRMVEYQTFYPMISDVTQYAFTESLSDYNTIPHDDSVKYWAVRNATVYFAVAMSLISGENVTVPSDLATDVDFYLSEIYAQVPRFVEAGEWQYPVGDTVEGATISLDFTQFTVRGHYVGIPRLEQYFRTMMWYGNFPICIPRNDESYSWSVSHINDAATVYARDILKQNPQYFNEWMLLYNVTSVLVGESDSINPLGLETALHNAFGESAQYLDLVAAPGGLATFRDELDKPEYAQKILGQALQAGDSLARYPLVFQFMGQRYVPDSFMFQMLCWDKTGTTGHRRVLPKGLDLFAVLGSERAYDLLQPDFSYVGFGNNLETLKSNFSNLTEDDWQHSSYMSWMYSLQSLIDIEYDTSYPAFMRTSAWQDEKLNTASGSWAQLRHDTLLYAKQTYIPTWVCSYPEAFVEPNPTFYSRMQQLSEKTIEALSILPTNGTAPIASYYSETIVMDSLETIKSVTQKLETISTKELAKQPLTSEETDFIKQIAYTTEGCGGVNGMGWYVTTIQSIAQAANYTQLLDVPLIADVATFPPGDIIPPQILHVGVGYVNALVVLYPMPNGTLVAAVGPVFSYYEFPLIGTKRLNDDEWKTMLTWDNRSEYMPAWVKDSPITPYATPEYTAVTVIVVTTVATAAIALTRIRRTKKKHFQSSPPNRGL
jgi:hypothetical protein